MKNKKLWDAINTFQFDDPSSSFTFSKRLARDNHWSHSFALHVIEEYRKFIYLCCVGYSEITPSDAVDQAWHLHLTYTKSYWVDLCQNVLNRPLHHNPTNGGDHQRNKFNECYNQLFEIYFSEFDVTPPEDIWPETKKRFTDVNFARVNLSQYWLLKRPSFQFKILISLPLLSFLFMGTVDTFPWVAFILVVIFIFIFARNLKKSKRSKKSRRKSRENGEGSIWTDLWGCSGDSDHSGCSSHGCSSGCAGCGGD